MVVGVRRVFIVPDVFSSKLRRDLLKVISSEFNVGIRFKSLPSSGRGGVVRGYFYLDVPEDVYKRFVGLLVRFGISFSKRESDAVGLFEDRVVVDALRELREGVPIGVSSSGNRLVILDIPGIGVSRDRLVPLFLSQVFDNVLWIGREFPGYRNFLELVDGLELEGISRGGLFELAKIITSETVGTRHVVDVVEKMSEGESLMEDEEFVVSSDAERVLRHVEEWGFINFSKAWDGGKHLLDLSGLPRLAVDLAIACGFFLDYDLVVVDYLRFNPRVLGYIKRHQSFILITRYESPNWAGFVVDSKSGSLVRRYEFGGRTIYYSESFTPLWGVFGSFFEKWSEHE